MEEGEEVILGIDLESFSTGPGLSLLEEATKDAEIPEEKVERFKSVYAQMFEELKRATENDKNLENQFFQLEK